MNFDDELLEQLTRLAEQKPLLECDGLTRLLSYVLRLNGIEHLTMVGTLQLTATEDVLPHHCWIQIGDSVLDFRVRMWLGNIESIPHGLFIPSRWAVTYSGHALDMQISRDVFRLLVSTGSP